MYLTVTKAQFQTALDAMGISTMLYAALLGQVTQVAVGNGAGWVGFAISGSYSETDFNADYAGVVKVQAIALA